MPSYDAIRDHLETGDLVFFPGGRGLFAWLIRRGNLIAGYKKRPERDFVHVGMIVRDDKNDMVLLSESTIMSRLKDIATGKRINGLHTVELSARLREVGGVVYIRGMKMPLQPQQIRRLAELRHKYKWRKYERKIVDLFRAAFDWFGPQNKGDDSSLFCSEWVALVDQELGLISDATPADEYIPAQQAVMDNGRGDLVKVWL